MNPNRIATTLAFFAISLLIPSCSTQRPGVSTSVITVAGSSGEFGEPFGIAIRGGDTFFSDGDRGKLFRISKDGVVTELGSGLHTPSGIAFAQNGDLIVADAGTHSIKRVHQNGTFETIAGVDGNRGSADGEAAQALFSGPVGVAVSEDGTIFVADTYNDRIRVVKNGVVSTWAGSSRGFRDGVGSEAKFDTPLGLAIWKERLLVADAGNRRIRVIEPDGSVWTLAGNGESDLRDGLLGTASFVEPSAIATDAIGNIYVADGNAIRRIGGRVTAIVETIAGGQRGFQDGRLFRAQFSRPSGLGFSEGGELLVADSENRVIRRFSAKATDPKAAGTPTPISAEEFRSLQPGRWPFEPPDSKRDIAGTLGEIRGEMTPENQQVWFHNGLDIAGQYGETARSIRNEKVLDPSSAENCGTLRELIRMPTVGYIHLRLGRDKDDKLFDDGRFQFNTAEDGTIYDVRISRGTEFAAGDPVGTLNAMNHVHLIAGRTGAEMNALAALELPNVSDAIVPIIEQVTLLTNDWSPIETENGNSRIRLVGNIRVVARAFDRMDGNPERRKLGVYKLGYQVLKSDGSMGFDAGWTIRFDRMPPHEAARFAYANGSHSGATGETIFNYIVTNQLDGAKYREGFLETGTLEPGNYSIRVYAADFFGNTSTKDIPIEVIR